MKLEWRTCLKVGVSLFLLYLCIHYWPALSGLVSALFGASVPLLIGAAVAYILNILMSAYERTFFGRSTKEAVQKAKRPMCLLGAILTLIAILVLVIGLVVPQLASCVQLIIAELPDFMRQALAVINEWGVLPENIMQNLESVDWQSWIGQIVSGLGGVMEVLFSAVSSVFSALVTALLALIFAIYLLAGKERSPRLRPDPPTAKRVGCSFPTTAARTIRSRSMSKA